MVGLGLLLFGYVLRVVLGVGSQCFCVFGLFGTAVLL